MTRPRVGASRRSGARSLAAALGASIAGPMPILLAGTLAVQLQEDIGVDAQVLGIGVTGFFLGSTAFSVLAGRTADRLGWRSALRIGVAASGLCLLLLSVLASDAVTFTIMLLMGSIGHSFANPAGARALSEELPGDRLGLVFGIKQSANPLAGMFAGASVPVIALAVGWRWAFASAVVFPFVAWVAAARPDQGARRRPADVVDAVRRRLGSGHGGTEELAESRAPSAPAVVPPLRMAPIVALAFTGGLATFGATALSTFVVLTVVDSGVSPGLAGTFVLVSAFLGMCVRIGSGWWADRSGSGGIRPIAVMMLGGAVSYMMLASGSTVLALPAMILAYAGGWGWPGLFMFGIVHHHRQAAGRATGLVQIGMMLGGALAPVFFGFVATRFGFDTAWTGVAVLSVIAAIVATYAAHALDKANEPEVIAE